MIEVRELRGEGELVLHAVEVHRPVFLGAEGLDLELAPSMPALSSTRKLLQWTATEATLKAAGAGLRRVAEVSTDLDALASVFDGRRYVLREVLLAPDTLGHVASSTPVELEIELVALDDARFSAALERVLGLTAQRSQ